MSNQVVIPLDAIDEDDLIELVDRIKSLTHAEVKIARQFVLTSDRPSVLSGIDALFGEAILIKDNPLTDPSARVVKRQKKQVRKPKVETDAARVLKKPRGKHVKSWDIVSTGQRVSRLELDKMLADHSIGLQSKLHHPKHGSVSVVLGADDVEPFMLMNEMGDLV